MPTLIFFNGEDNCSNDFKTSSHAINSIYSRYSIFLSMAVLFDTTKKYNVIRCYFVPPYFSWAIVSISSYMRRDYAT